MEWQDQLKRVFEYSVRDAPGNVGVLFSGGLDSSFVAHLLNRDRKKVHLYSSFAPASHDSVWAPKAASLLGLHLNSLVKNEEETVKGIRSIKDLTGETSPLVILIELPLYFVSRESTVSILATGQGADELFLGYKKYEREDTSEQDLKKVLESVVPLERTIAANYGKELFYPYLDNSVIELVSRIPRDQKIRNGVRKYALRSAASSLNLNDEIAWKPKKAAQYSSGFKDVVSKLAKRESKTVHEYISEL